MTFELPSCSLLFKLCSRTTTKFKPRPLPLRHIDQMELGNTHVGLLWKSFQLVAGAATYTTHNNHKRQMSIPSVGFETSIPIVEGLHIYTLDRAATGISVLTLQLGNNNKCFWHFTKLKFKTHPLIKWIYQLYLYSNFNGFLIHTHVQDRPFQFHSAFIIVLHILPLPWLNPLIELDGSVQQRTLSGTNHLA